MAPPKLTALPPGFVENRDAAHRLAAYAVAIPLITADPELAVASGLTVAPGGFATPMFGQREQIRVSGDEMIHQRAGRVNPEMISTLDEARAQLDIAADVDATAVLESAGFIEPFDVGPTDEPLEVDLDAMDALSVLLDFSKGALGECRHAWKPLKPSSSRLRPDTFTLEFEVIDPSDPDIVMRFGVSPGDADQPTPYWFVTLDESRRKDIPRHPDYWNAPFGAMLRYEQMPVNPDEQRPRVVAFLQAGLLALAP